MMVVDIVSDNPRNKFAPYQQMANAIIDLTNKKGSCAPDDLLAAGFEKNEVASLWHMSKAMADIEIRLADSDATSTAKK